MRRTSAEITWPVFIFDRVNDSSNNSANDSDILYIHFVPPEGLTG
jgi:hypothetical protein